MVNVLDKFVESLTKPTVIVLDNASIHTSAEFKLKMQEWEKKDLFIFYLPPYSPHLNICERVWKELKARWIRVQDYANFQTLKLRIMEVLANIGVDFCIDYQKFEYS